MALLNVAGLARQTGIRLGVFQDFLAEQCAQRGCPGWREKYCCIRRGAYLGTLRQMFSEVFGLQHWLEWTSGYSWHHYAVLDLYLRIMSHGAVAPATEAHFLVQSTCDVGERWLPTPDQWYCFQDLVSDGERLCVAEWDLDVVYDTQASEEVVGSSASDWSGIVFGEALSVRVLHLWLSGVRAATMQLSMKVVFFCEATTLDTGQAGLWLCCRFECHDSIWMRSVSNCSHMSVAFYGGTPRAIEGLFKCQEQLRDVGTAVLRRDGFGEHLRRPL